MYGINNVTSQTASESIQRLAAKRHDGLCIIESGLSSCWCLKPCCWESTGRIWWNSSRGRCICPDCTCRGVSSFLRTRPQIPVRPNEPLPPPKKKSSR